MKNKYSDLIDQTFQFPTEEFETNDNGELIYRDIPMMDLVKKYGSPLRFSYLPKISENIQKAKFWFAEAFAKHNYTGKYNYCYCTKSSHFKYVLEEALKNDVHIETSSAFDLDIVKTLHLEGKIDLNRFIICNGFKTESYVNKILDLVGQGFENLHVILDNTDELDLFANKTKKTINIGIRIASEEEPKFEFWTSRLGIGYKFIVPFYEERIKQIPNLRLKMLHFFINTGIRDTAYYWNELNKCLNVYTTLAASTKHLEHLNIGGGFPIKQSLNFTYDYGYMVSEIVQQIKSTCLHADISVPNLFTEFGSYTVGESSGTIYKVIGQKKQNDRELWNMIDSSFMTTLPDTWAINERFILLPLNKWNSEYERVLLGGLTCDSDDYYNSEQHVNAIYMPKYTKGEPLYLGFFHTGAYQESLGGSGGIKHCLIPDPKKVLINRNENGELTYELWSDEQSSESMMKILGY
ncbi:MAG: arginine decarboxylase [Bacteroidetes bacterium]|nr:MAG: arginine decarboxylase [Bacteroidota bacterium]